MKTEKKWLLAFLALVQFLVVVDGTIVNIALPEIGKSLHMEERALQWVITAYVLVFGGFLMLGGRVADLYGRKRTLLVGTATFIFFSFLLGFAWDATSIILLRALQGLGAAFMAPTALSAMLTNFQEEGERNRALSILNLVASGGAGLGVFLGGFLTTVLSWHAIFFVNVPFGLIAILGLIKLLPEHEDEEVRPKLDVTGSILITTALLLLIYTFTLASQPDTALMSILTIGATSLGLLGWFVLHERRHEHPLIPGSIFRVGNVLVANIIMMPIVAGMFGLFFFSTLFVQNILHYTPLQSGLTALPIPILIGVLSWYAPKLIAKFGFKSLYLVGTTLALVGTFMLSFVSQSTTYLNLLLPSYILLGLGMGTAFVSLFVAATSGVPANKSGLAAGLINTMQQVGGAIGISLLVFASSATAITMVQAGESEISATIGGYRVAFQISALLLLLAVLIGAFGLKKTNQSY